MSQPDNLKTLKYAFIVKDFKTYTNAEEAWYAFSGKKKESVLFVIVPKRDHETFNTLKQLVDPDKWKKIVWFRSLSNYPVKSALKGKLINSKTLIWLYESREHLYSLMDRLALDKLGKKYGPLQTVFSGHRNTQEHLAASLKPNELYIMDSGANIQKRIKSSGHIDVRKYGRRTPVKYFINKIISFKLFDRERTKLFTVYADSVETRHDVVKNEYAYREMLVKSMESGDDILYISSPIYAKKERGVSLEGYAQFVNDIFKHLKLDPKKVIYIPHPVHEDDDSVKKIVEILGCRADSRRIPIETKITIHDKLPRMCITPYSSALVNLSKFAANKIKLIYAWHGEFDCFEHLSDWKNSSLKNNPHVEIVPIMDTPSMFNVGEGDCEKPRFKHFKDLNRH